MKPATLPREGDYSRDLHKRFILIASVVLAALLVAALYTGSDSRFHSRGTLLKASSVGFLSEANPEPNPGFTVGPTCTMRVMLLIDRSGSILGNADPSGSQTDANTIKSTVNSFYDVLKNRANGFTGSNATVMVDAFATYSIPQNGQSPSPSYGLQGWNWLESLDLADPSTHSVDKPGRPLYPPDYLGKTNLQYQKDVINSIWYYGDKTQPFDPSKPNTAYRGYYGTTGFQVNTSLGTTGTNYDDALISAARQISFWTDSPTGNNYMKGGDDDFDLVLVVSDGQPTMNDGPDHVPDVGPPAEAGLINNGAEPIDVQYAKNEVNVLRTGRAFKDENGNDMTGYWGRRPKVNVIGIIAGKEAKNPTALGNMDAIYGSNAGIPANKPKNWYATNGFAGDLADALKKSVDDIGCKKPEPKHPSISLTTSPSGSVSINEGDSQTVVLKVKNTSSDTTLRNIKITKTVGGVESVVYSGPTDTILPGATLIPDKTYTFNVPLGAASPIVHTLKVTADAVLDEGDTIAPGFTDPATDSKTITFTVIRKRLPS